MMHIHHSNRTERLLERFVALATQPLADAMEPEVVVVQNPGMARWLAQQLAMATGIAANLDFPLPASFVWRVHSAWLPDMPEETGYDRESLQWRVLGLLAFLLPRPEFGELRRYLKDDESEIKAYQLAGRIADVFDQYLVYRPDMMLQWQAGNDDHWQAVLWREVVEKTAGGHRADLFARFRRVVDQGIKPCGRLPERVSLFGLSALAPVHLHAFQALARYCPVHLFLLNPCAEYWTDIVDDRGQARRRALWRQRGAQDLSGMLDVGNPLLASLGHAGQGFLDQLLDTGAQDHDGFQDPGEHTLLNCLQHDILTLQDRRDARDQGLLSRNDSTVQVHVCHSPIREVQVLHDRLISLFETFPDLCPRQIVVMAPDIDIYAPHVEAVFDSAPKKQRIPWTIADRKLQAEQPVIETVLALLDLPSLRLTASEVLSFLEVPAVCRRFGLEADAIDRIRTWVFESGIRWGADAAMRKSMDLPAEPANTWEAGLARLFLGYAMPPTETFFGDTLSYPDVEGTDAEPLGALQTLLDRLVYWRSALDHPVSASDWLQRINGLIDDFLAPDIDEEQHLQALRRIADSWQSVAGKVGLEALLNFRVIKSHLETRLGAGGGARRFLLGGVTFCNMVPMRSIPFRVVCLLGLNDTVFPRDQHPPSFDLIASQPRPGDRSRRMDDRYLFLEALLSARDLFYLSYIGRDVRDNSIRVPSVVVSELLDYIDRSWSIEGRTPSGKLVVNHPLQPFSPRLFNGSDPALFSYDHRWLQAAGQTAASEIQPFVRQELPEPDAQGKILEIDDLVGFFTHPAAFFLKQRLGIRLDPTQDPLSDDEPFDVNGLERFFSRKELVNGLLADEPAAAIYRRVRARGQLPHGALGDLAWTENLEGMQCLVDRVKDQRGTGVDPVELDLSLGAFTLRGWLQDLSHRGRLAFRPARLKARDRLRLWLNHLLLCAAAPPGVAPVSTHIASDRILHLDRAADARTVLQDLLALWWQGQLAPLPFFPETSWAYADVIHKGKNEDAAMAACQKVWEEAYQGRGEALDPAIQMAWRGNPPLESRFQTVSGRVFFPICEAATEEKIE
jgi:exodeoxyribonuclease V gamma subunit